MIYDLVITNTYLKKRVEHLVTFKSGSNKLFWLGRQEGQYVKTVKLSKGRV